MGIELEIYKDETVVRTKNDKGQVISCFVSKDLLIVDYRKFTREQVETHREHSRTARQN